MPPGAVQRLCGLLSELLGVKLGHQRLAVQAEIGALGAPEKPANEIQQALLRKFEAEAIGSDLRTTHGTAWAAYQAVTEYLSHESGRNKDPDLAARQRFESLYWGKSAETIKTAHIKAVLMR